ncbi:hypothetical protein CTAM01_05063 [Colletotrichum tamarilloi]|uniref:Uncharacterized protein n=1 Tax=Colletotrichum tamarilloi TaxID=1209934 RepID=A0ABQ9RGT2_9PEZI|nr:uncharacterized protein CTAM01_05063 [Colletotrichum tamarilloi]KAK1503074.1 hypothetical protein CTAM01_05063 [Colletotrichum tamarilloi]
MSAKMLTNKKIAQRKAYFIIPNTQYRPDDQIQLGQLIEDPLIPHRPLAPPIRPFPANAAKVRFENDWSQERSMETIGDIGVFGQFLSAASAESSINRSIDVTRSWSAARLETTFLDLGADREHDYVKSSVQTAAVQKLLTSETFFKKLTVRKKVLYMVTGIKIARSPHQISHGESKMKGGAVKLGADPGTGGAVMTGIQGSLSISIKDVKTCTPHDDFVFAYCLRKVHVNLRNNKTQLGGDVLGAEMDRVFNRMHYSQRNTEEESDEEEPQDIVVHVDEIQKILFEKDDFGHSLPARYAKNNGFDETNGGKCIVIVAK